MEIIRDIVPAGRSNRPGFEMTPLYITIHDTGNLSAGAREHANYLKNPGTQDSWHFTVDDKEVIQHLELNENGWHAGDGRYGMGNRRSIGIEICMHHGQDRAKAEENAAQLVAYLLKTVPSLMEFPEAIKQHHDWTGKNCPQVLRGRPNGWEGFLKLVEKAGTPQWKLDLMKRAEELKLIDTAQHSPDEPADKWFVLAVAVNLIDAIERRK